MGIPPSPSIPRTTRNSLHLRVADEARALPGSGAAAYLERRSVDRGCQGAGCDAIHPGYGFLAERGDFARPAPRRA